MLVCLLYLEAPIGKVVALCFLGLAAGSLLAGPVELGAAVLGVTVVPVVVMEGMLTGGVKLEGSDDGGWERRSSAIFGFFLAGPVVVLSSRGSGGEEEGEGLVVELASSSVFFLFPCLVYVCVVSNRYHNIHCTHTCTHITHIHVHTLHTYMYTHTYIIIHTCTPCMHTHTFATFAAFSCLAFTLLSPKASFSLFTSSSEPFTCITFSLE